VGVRSHVEKTVAVGPKTIAKLTLLKDTLTHARVQTQSTNFEFDDIEKDLTISIWAHSVVHSTVDIYYIIKFYRRKCRLFNNLQGKLPPSPVWRDALAQWIAWIEDLVVLKRTVRRAPDPNTSPTVRGFGAVLRFDDQIRIIAGRWDDFQRTLHINMLELLAVRIAVEAIEDVLPLHPSWMRLAIMVDNTSVVGRLRDDRILPSSDFQAHLEVNRIHRISDRFAEYTISYVRSADNEADYWSRVHDPRSRI
jgi:hypothetical protein